MNVDDTQSPEADDDRLVMIFDRQEELSKKYKEIEKANGIGLLAIAGEEPYSIDDSKFQYVIKDYAWRIVEEVAESLESLTGEGSKPHTQEELADALHFMVELCIHVGIAAEDVAEFAKGVYSTCMCGVTCTDDLDLLYKASVYDEKGKTIHTAVSYFILNLGCAMNCLKNKPWKVTQMETDVKQFKRGIYLAFMGLIAICHHVEMTGDGIFDFYFRKSEVNKFRIGSNY